MDNPTSKLDNYLLAVFKIGKFNSKAFR
jgi:hypothetical protein